MSFSMEAMNRAMRTMSSSFASNSDIMAKSLERISTGSRINRASDDFTGFAKLADLAVDTRTYTDGANKLNEDSAILQQVLDVANQMMDDLQNMETALNNGDTDLAAGYGESVEQALTLTTSQSVVLINDDLITDLTLTMADGTTALTDTLTDFETAGDLPNITDASVVADVTAAIGELETFINEVSGIKATIDSQQSLADVMASNSEAVASAITEIDEAEEMAKYIDADIRQQAAISMFSQANLSRRNLSNLYT